MSRVEALMEFIREDAGDTFSRYALGLEYLKDGNDQEALKHFLYLEKNHADYLATYYQMGKLLERMSKHEAAVEIYEKGRKVAIAQRNMHALSELNAALDELNDQD